MFIRVEIRVNGICATALTNSKLCNYDICKCILLGVILVWVNMIGQVALFI